MHPAVKLQLERLFVDCQLQLKRLRREGMPIKEVTQICSQDFMDRAAEILHKSVDTMPVDKTEKCGMHPKKKGGCPLFPTLHPTTQHLYVGKLHIVIIGIECTPWSSMGSKKGVLDPKFLASLQVLFEALVEDADIILVENTEHFKTSLVLRPILCYPRDKPRYEIREFVVSPSQVTLPEW